MTISFDMVNDDGNVNGNGSETVGTGAVTGFLIGMVNFCGDFRTCDLRGDEMYDFGSGSFTVLLSSDAVMVKWAGNNDIIGLAIDVDGFDGGIGAGNNTGFDCVLKSNEIGRISTSGTIDRFNSKFNAPGLAIFSNDCDGCGGGGPSTIFTVNSLLNLIGKLSST